MNLSIFHYANTGVETDSFGFGSRFESGSECRNPIRIRIRIRGSGFESGSETFISVPDRIRTKVSDPAATL